MHETQLAREILNAALEEAHRRSGRLQGVKIELSKTSHESSEALEFAFSAVTEGTEAAGAKLEIERVPGRLTCPHCGHEFEAEDVVALCPQCEKIVPHGDHDHDLRIVAVTLE